MILSDFLYSGWSCPSKNTPVSQNFLVQGSTRAARVQRDGVAQGCVLDRTPMLQDRNTYDSNKTFWRAATRRSLAPQCEPATLNNVHDELGMTPLMWASMYTEEPAVIELLIERSANVRAVTKHGVTALHWAAHYNKSARAVEIVQALLLGGADPSARAKNGLTAAEFALDNGNSAVAAVLVKHPRP